jgi:hypothetical protein
LVLKNRRTLATTASFTASTTSTIQLPRDFLVQRINLDYLGTVVLSGTSTLVSGAGFANAKFIRVKAVGEGSSRTIFEIKGEDLGNLNYFQYSNGATSVTTPTTSGTHTDGVEFHGTLDFRTDYHDPDDYSVAIPSYLLSTLQLEIEWNTNALGYGSAVTSQTGTLRITLIEGIPEGDEDFSGNPLQTTLYKQLNGDSSSGSTEQFDTLFNVGALIRTNFLITETSAGALSDGEIDYYTVNSGQIPIISKENFRASKQQDIEDWNLTKTVTGNQTVTGWTAIDYMNPLNPFINTADGLEIDGLDTTGFNVGDLSIDLYKNNASSIIRTIQITVEG